MNEFQIYSGGKFLTTGNPIEVRNPFNGEVVGQTYLAGPDELEHAIIQAQYVEKELRKLPSFIKYEILMQIAESIKKEKEEFAGLLCLESAKPIRYALSEVDRAIQTFIVAAEESKRLPKEYIDLDWTACWNR